MTNEMKGEPKENAQMRKFKETIIGSGPKIISDYLCRMGGYGKISVGKTHTQKNEWITE